jgi:hypothetical protein
VLRRLLTTGLVLAGVLALPGAAQASSTIPPALAAQYGAGWVGRQLDGTGYVAGLGGPSYNTTALGVLALVAAGVGEEQAAKATTYLMAHVDEFVEDADGKDQPAALAALVLVAHARNLGPATLVTRLLATKRTTGDDAGLFGEQDATYDGAFRQSMALLALAAAGQTDADAVAWLKGEQCADGGWMGNRPEAAPCPAFDMSTFVGEDSNGTALATQALVALGEMPDHDPLEFLATTQNADGGFAFVPGFDSDANSTALAIQALIAAGEDLVEWAKPNGAPEAFLLGLQLGNPPEATAGAFAFQGAKTLVANAFATVQAVPALAGKAFPLAPATLSNDLPLLPAKVVATLTVAPTTTAPSPIPTALPTRAARVPELPATGPGRKPWDATGQAVLGLGLIGYGVLALGGARLARRR